VGVGGYEYDYRIQTLAVLSFYKSWVYLCQKKKKRCKKTDGVCVCVLLISKMIWSRAKAEIPVLLDSW
jgi:hypothetical protein